jgi:Subtilase family
LPSSFKNQTIITNKEYKMKKALLALLSATLVFTVISPAQAEDQKVLAVIDSAIKSEKFPSIIYEACFTVGKTCPNGANFMEGKGSASAPWPTSINNGTYHGDSMVKAALVANPNIKIVFVRYSDVSALGNSLSSPDALVNAIKWVSENADKYSIDAVSISQSSVSVNNLNRCKTDNTLISSVGSLKVKNIPTFVATGNDKRSDVVGFPACVEGAIGVGALANISQLETASNRGPGLDLVAFSKVSITKANDISWFDLSGSSSSTAVSASAYLAKNKFATFVEYFNSLPKISVKFIDGKSAVISYSSL